MLAVPRGRNSRGSFDNRPHAADQSSLDGRSFLPVLLGKSGEHKKYTYGIQTTRGIIRGSEAFGVRSCGTKTHRYIRNLHSETEFTNATKKLASTSMACATTPS